MSHSLLTHPLKDILIASKFDNYLFTSVCGHQPFVESLNKTKRQRNMLSTWANPSIFSCLTASEVLVLEPLDLLNSVTSFPHFPACRWQIVKLLSVNYWWFCFFDDLANMDRDMTCTLLTFTSGSSHPSFRFRSFLLRFYFTVWNM